MSTRTVDSANSFSEQLFTIMCSEFPTFTDVLNLFTSDSFYKSEHYIFLAKPTFVTYYYTLCSDVLTNQKFDPSLIPTDSVLSFDSPQDYNGYSNVSEVRLFHIDDSHVLLLINPSQPPSDNLIISQTISALQTLSKRIEIDIPYTIRAVQNMSNLDLENLAKRSFSVTQFHPAELFQNLIAMFVRSEISTKVGVVTEDLIRFLVNLRNHYNDVPYHNWFHAIDVTQFVFYVFIQVKMTNYLTDYEIFGLLLSAITHDTDHNGMNNTFHRKAHTIFAHLAPNLPPLEHHHSCITMDLARDILNSIDETERLSLCHFIINAIMATDMEQHKDFLEKFKSIQEKYIQTDKDHRQLLAQIVLKAADLSNTVRDFNEANRMALQLCKETHRQGDEEKRLGLPVSPMCDRDDKTPLCKGQIGFYKFVARPLMKELHDFFPDLSDNERQFVENLATWEKMTAELEQ